MAFPQIKSSRQRQENNEAGILYIVGTPIGNFEDISIRALRTLGEVDFILAENCRVINQLLAHYDIHKEVLSYRIRSDQDVLLVYLDRILKGENIALVCDAGTPSVADPGFKFINLAVKNAISVQVVPGVSALTSALSISGWPAGSCTFLGFAPRSRSDRDAFFKNLTQYPRPLVLFEKAPLLESTIEEIAHILGKDTQIFICKDLTKKSEQQFRCKAGGFSLDKQHLKHGEFVLMVK